VVIGGGVAQAGAALFDPLRAELRRRARLAFARDVRVEPAALGPEAGVVGAAALVLQERGTRPGR
jgi:glucokinase